MPAAWPIVPLGEAMVLDVNQVPVDPAALYRIAGVYSFGKGLLARGPLSGTQTTYKYFHQLHEGQFVLSQLKAWEGAVAKVSASFDGWFLSPQFPTFRPISGKLDIDYLDWYCKQSRVWESFRGGARGMGARRDSVSPKTFLAHRIPLPPPAEQRRIVARIEELAAKIEEARRLRNTAVEETSALRASAAREAFAIDNERAPLDTLCLAIIDNLHSNPVYADSGVPCIRSSDVGWGELFLHTARRTSEAEYKRRTVRGEPATNDIVLVREGGGTGKAALVKQGVRFSLGQRVLMLRPDPKKVLPKFLLLQLLSPRIYEDRVLAACTGSASPHLNIGDLRRFDFMVPPIEQQRRIVAHLESIWGLADQLTHKQSGASAELDALLPSILDKAFKGEL